VDVLVSAVALADRRPDGIDDDRVTHEVLRARSRRGATSMVSRKPNAVLVRFHS
jgi:hypothetical protein